MAFFHLSATIFFLAGLWLTRGVQFRKNSSSEEILVEIGPAQIGPPFDVHKWWLIDEATSLHTEAKHQTNSKETPLENLQDAWENKMGKGFPAFYTRKIDFQEPGFTYMFPAGEPSQQQVYDLGIFEPYISYHLVGDIKECCQKGNGHFLDVGAQFGWYSLLSASLGCQVDAYEPVPWFQSLLAYNRQENNRKTLHSLLNAHADKFMGNASGKRHTMVMPTQDKGVLDISDGVGEEKCDHGASCLDIAETTIDDETESMKDIESCAVKIDAEGTEPEVVEGAKDFLRQKLPKIIVIEVSPGMQKKFKRSDSANMEMLQYVTQLGYIPYLLHWDLIRTYNVNVAQGSMESKKSSKPLKQLLKDCGVNCIMYFKRSW